MDSNHIQRSAERLENCFVHVLEDALWSLLRKVTLLIAVEQN